MKLYILKNSIRRLFKIKSNEKHVFILINASGQCKISLCHKGANAHIFALYTGKNNDNFQLSTIQNHCAENTYSNLMVQGVFTNNAQLVFNGLIHINKDAKKSIAYQKNNHLILSNTVSIEAQPDLDICTNDIICTHSTTITGLTDSNTFYLQSRGISKKNIKKLLIHAFYTDLYLELKKLSIDAKQIEELYKFKV